MTAKKTDGGDIVVDGPRGEPSLFFKIKDILLDLPCCYLFYVFVPGFNKLDECLNPAQIGFPR